MKTPEPSKENPSAPNSAQFTGTDNPRHLRVIATMLRRPTSRQELDSLAGCANGPALVQELRERGLAVPCQRITVIDRDGMKCHPGVYDFTASDRRKLHQWMAKRSTGCASAPDYRPANEAQHG
jgi:hypothetical protein